VLNGFGETQPSVAFPVGQTLGANRVQPANSKGGNWWQSPLCGVSRPASPKTVKHLPVFAGPEHDDMLIRNGR
jgi:hypothetical protein